jgi:putative Holliday junction resolvase
MTEVRQGIRIGVDVGKVRIGVAQSDRFAMLATPVETVARAGDGGSDIQRIMAIADEADALELVVGLPLSLAGTQTASTADALEFAARLAAASPRPVRLVDERLSTVSAHSALRVSGKSQKSSRKIVDQVAAVIILQHALDAERGGGTPPGVIVAPNEGPPIRG